MDWFHQILRQLISLRIFLPFIPLFVAFNVLGILPIFFSLTSEVAQPERKRVIRQSILTAFIVSIGLLAQGNRSLLYWKSQLPIFRLQEESYSLLSPLLI
jgi:small neutral amino acid transporter SnatA (MarC family)